MTVNANATAAIVATMLARTERCVRPGPSQSAFAPNRLRFLQGPHSVAPYAGQPRRAAGAADHLFNSGPMLLAEEPASRDGRCASPCQFLEYRCAVGLPVQAARGLQRFESALVLTPAAQRWERCRGTWIEARLRYQEASSQTPQVCPVCQELEMRALDASGATITPVAHDRRKIVKDLQFIC